MVGIDENIHIFVIDDIILLLLLTIVDNIHVFVIDARQIVIDATNYLWNFLLLGSTVQIGEAEPVWEKNHHFYFCKHVDDSSQHQYCSHGHLFVAVIMIKMPPQLNQVI